MEFDTMPLLDLQPGYIRRRLAILAALIVTLGVPTAAHTYDAVRPYTPLAARLADLARRTGQPLAPMLAAPQPWLESAMGRVGRAPGRESAGFAGIEGSALAGPAPSPIQFADPVACEMPQPVAIGDFNGDGRMDLVVHGPSGAPALMLATADGFAAPVEYPVGSPACAVGAGDVNGDGRTDLVAWVTGSGLAVRLSVGDGTLGPVSVSALAGTPTSLALGDLDGDGRLDVVALESRDSTLIVARNAGGGTFPAADRYGMADGAFNFTLGDFNGDGLLDVAVICLPSNPLVYIDPMRALSVRLAQAGGLLGDRRDYIVSHLPWSISAGDMDGDGRSDLLVGWFAGVGFDIVRANPDGSLQPTDSRLVNRSTHNESAVALADMDADGRAEIVLGYPDGDCFDGRCMALVVFRNDGHGAFAESTSYLALGGGYSTRGTQLTSILAADFDGDHATDLLIGGQFYNGGSIQFRSALLRRRGATLLAPARQLVGTGPYALGAGRFRHGSLRDLVTSGDSSVGILRNRGDGSYLPPQDLASGALGTVADLNRDGLDDLVIARAETTVVMLADGSGGFGPPQELVAGAFLDAADFAGHGALDLAVALAGGTVGVMPNDGSGHFGPPVDFGASLAGARLVRAADLDGDGRADFMMARASFDSEENDSLAVFWNHGGGFLASVVLDIGTEYGYVPISAPPADIQVGDFDGDGRLDIVVAKGTFGFKDSGGSIQILTHLSAREFAARIEYYAGPDPWGAAVADFDRDGLDDIAIADVRSSDNGRVNVFHARGGGAFDARQGYLVEHFPSAIVAADLDGDDRPDLAVGHYFPHSVWTLPNVSPPSPATPALAALINSEAWSDRVSLTWLLSAARSGSVIVERRAPAQDWKSLATAAVDGTGHVAYVDRGVAAGSRYGYRLRVGHGASAKATAETWIDVPGVAALIVSPAGGNPSRGALRVAFALPTRENARIEIYDLSGRRMLSHSLAAPASGRGEVALEGDSPMGAGLYFVTLTQGNRTARARIALVR